MKKRNKTQDDDFDWRDSPAAWLFLYEKAIRSGDKDGAWEARKNLERLGLVVKPQVFHRYANV